MKGPFQVILSVYILKNNLKLVLDKWGRGELCGRDRVGGGKVYIQTNLNHRFLTVCQQSLIIALLLNTHTHVNESHKKLPTSAGKSDRRPTLKPVSNKTFVIKNKVVHKL